MKRFLTVFLPILLIALILTGCANHIVDTNGADNITPVELTDEDIIKGRSAVTLAFFKSTIGNTSTVKCKKMSGIKEINGIGEEEQSGILTYTASVASGNLRLCLVDTASDTILADLTLDGLTHALKLSSLKPSSDGAVWVLKAAGESASFTLDYTIAP